MRPGDIVFVRGHDVVSNIIRLFEPGPYTHVAVAISSTQIIEAQYATKVHIAEMDYNDYTVIDLNLTDEQREKVPELATDLVGRWYNYLEILGILFNQRKWTIPRALICTQVAMKILTELNVIPKQDMFPYLKPNEFFKFVMVDLPKIKVVS